MSNEAFNLAFGAFLAAGLELERLIQDLQGGGGRSLRSATIRGNEPAEALDYADPDTRWVARVDTLGLRHCVELEPLRVVARGRKLIKVAPCWHGDQIVKAGSFGAPFWVRRPHQAAETPRLALHALLERKKHAVHHARVRLRAQEKERDQVGHVLLDMGVSLERVNAPPVFEPSYDHDEGEGSW